MVITNHFIESQIKLQKHSKENVTQLEFFFSPQFIHSTLSTKDQGDNNKTIHNQIGIQKNQYNTLSDDEGPTT